MIKRILTQMKKPKFKKKYNFKENKEEFNGKYIIIQVKYSFTSSSKAFIIYRD